MPNLPEEIMSTDDLRHAALRDKAATDAAAHRGQNARLCEWLKIPQEVRHVLWCGLWSETPPLCTCRAQAEYPDLATREGFWVLWDALKAKGYLLRVQDCGLQCVAWMAKDGRQSVPTQIGETLQAALFQAAVALMEREGGNG